MDAGLVLRRLRADEVAAAHALEAVSYPEASKILWMVGRDPYADGL